MRHDLVPCLLRSVLIRAAKSAPITWVSDWRYRVDLAEMREALGEGAVTLNDVLPWSRRRGGASSARPWPLTPDSPESLCQSPAPACPGTHPSPSMEGDPVSTVSKDPVS